MKKTKRKYDTLWDQTTGKITREKPDFEGKALLVTDELLQVMLQLGEEEFDKFLSSGAPGIKLKYVDVDDDAPTEEYIPPEVLRTLACPFQLDNPEVYKEITKPLKQAKFTCQVDIEISLQADSDQQDNHQHDVILEVGKELHKPGVDPSEYELDYGSMFCGIFYNVTPKIQVKLLNKETIEDKSVGEYVEQIENKAAQENLVDPVELERNKQRLEGHENLFARMSEYIEKHLTEELKRVAERLTTEIHALDEKGKEREFNLNLILDEEGKEARKRLSIAKGRVPIKQQDDYRSEKEKFINQCMLHLEKLKKEKKKLNKSQLAESIFSDLNPLQTLRRKLKSFELSFEDILQQYSEHKSS